MKRNEDYHDEDEVDEDSDAPVDADYIEKVLDGLDGLAAEDFTGIKAKIPTEAEDGETVALLVTGTAKNGFLTDVYGTPIDLDEDEPESDEKKGRIKRSIESGDTED